MGKKVRNFLFVFFALVFCISLGVLIKLFVLDPNNFKKANDEIKAIYYNNYEKSENDDANVTLKKSFDNLSLINEDIKGWIKIDNTVIDYPVLQSSDPTFYLDHNYKKEYSRYGSIFIDSECKEGIHSKNIILHGHHMRDGQMFADILKFADLNFYKSTPAISFNTKEYISKWKIFSIFKTNTKPEQGEIFNYLAVAFANDASFLNFIDNLKIRSLLDINVDIIASDQIMLLSTCSYEFDDARTVLAARRVRQGESESVDTSTAKKNENPLKPSGWNKG